MTQTYISVIIPTFNRHNSLKRTLLSLLRQEFDKQNYEIIVADNCSSNWADSVIKEVKKRTITPEITHLKVSEQGVNKARNEGIKIAQGEIIAFCDDDVIVDRLWLTKLVEGFIKYSSVLVIGGKVEPIWEGVKPLWFPKRMEGCLAILDFGNTPVINPPWLVGANLAFRKETFRIFGSFDESLGRKKGSYLFKDEIELLERIRRKNRKILYLPDVKIKHFITKDRVTMRYLCKRVFSEGRSEARVDVIMNKEYFKVSIWLVVRSAFETFRGFLFLIQKDKELVVEYLAVRPIFCLGYLFQIMQEVYEKLRKNKT